MSLNNYLKSVSRNENSQFDFLKFLGFFFIYGKNVSVVYDNNGIKIVLYKSRHEPFRQSFYYLKTYEADIILMQKIVNKICYEIPFNFLHSKHKPKSDISLVVDFHSQINPNKMWNQWKSFQDCYK